MNDRVRTVIARYQVIILSLAIALSGIGFLVISALVPIPGGWAEFFSRLGTIFVPSGLISLVNQFVLRENFIADMREQITNALNLQLSSLRKQEYLGLRAIHETLPFDKVIKLIAESREEIRILQTWIPNVQMFEHALATAAENGAIIQILIFDPDSPFVEQRTIDLGYSNKEIGKESILFNIVELKRIITQHRLQNKVEIKTYSVLPSLQLYIADDTIFVGFFWHGTPSTLATTLEVGGANTVLANRFKREFLRVWESGAFVFPEIQNSGSRS